MKKTVLVTGASMGIGRQIAKRFAQGGHQVMVHYFRHEKEALALVEEIRQLGQSAMAIQADISDFHEVEQMFQKIFAHIPHIDVLVNNAGIAQQKLFTDITSGDWDRMFNVNVKGIYHCIQCVLPKMIAKKEGNIINISSVWGLTGASCEVHYSASKAAVIGLTKGLAKEVGPSGIRVNCVAPGVIDTEMNAALDSRTIEQLKEETPLGVMGDTADIANTVWFLASPDSKFITGQTISPNGGMVI